MAILEIQIRQDVFFEIVKAQIFRSPIPAEVVDGLFMAGKQLFNEGWLIERIEISDVAVANDTPKLGPVPQGALHLRVTAQVFLTTLKNARLAGHLAPPATLAPLEVVSWIRFDLNRQRTISYRVVDSTQEGFQINDTLDLGMKLPIEFTSWETAIIARDGAIAFRVGTDFEDIANKQAFLDWWGGNRLGAAHWGAFITGEVFAHQLAKKFNVAAQQLAAASEDPRIELTFPAMPPANEPTPHHNGVWVGPPFRAEARVEIKAIDAGFLDADVKSWMKVQLEVQPFLGSGVKLITTLLWDDDAPDEVSNVIADMARQAFAGEQEIGRGEYSISFSRTEHFSAPRSRGFSGDIASIVVDALGLAVTGAIRVSPRPSAAWAATAPGWTISGDCRTKSVGVKLLPPKVELIGTDPYFVLQQLQAPVSDPMLFWEWREGSSNAGDVPITLTVEFPLAGRLLGHVPEGLTASACLYTNVGVRWVDFGTVPPKPELSEREWLARTADLISNCMAISDRWGMGVMHLDWLVDPPPFDFGLLPVHEWLVLGSEIREVDTVQLTALRRDGRRRPLGSARVHGGTLLLHRIVTAADETLELRTGVAMAGPPPQIMRRWIVPQRTIPFERAPATFRLDGDLLTAVFDDGSSHVLRLEFGLTPSPGYPGNTDKPAILDTMGHGAADGIHRGRYDLKDSVAQVIDSAGGIALLHETHLVIGIAGKFAPVLGVAEKTSAPMPQEYANHVNTPS